MSGAGAWRGRGGGGGRGRLVLLLLVVMVCAWVAEPAPPPAARRSRRAVVDDSALVYLMKFGYLPQSDLETGSLRSDEQLRAAIRELQAFGNVSATGEMDAATRALLARPRCGLPDVDAPPTRATAHARHRRTRRFALHGRKWDYTNLTWSLHTRSPHNLDPRLVRVQLARALDVWAQNSKLTFVEEDGNDRADILVQFERGYHDDGYPFDGRGQILAHAFFPGVGRGGDAHFDEEENWALSDVSDESEGTSLFAVAAHEFGHSLGLSHSSEIGALMYPWYQGVKQNFQLPDDDRHGIQQLYGSKEDRKTWGPSIPSKPQRPPPVATTTTRRPYIRATKRRDPPRYNTPPPRYPAKNPFVTKRPHRPLPATTTTRRPYIHATKRRDPPRYNTPPPRYPAKYPRQEEDVKPNGCDMSYDAISVIRGEVFIFKGKYLWRIGNEGLLPNYPVEIRRLWDSLPEGLTHVDAVYERNDNKIVFFIGKTYYTFEANILKSRRPITHLGLPESLQKVDGAMVWNHNKKTYFFSETMYWRFDEEVGKVGLDYPRDMSMWRGVEYNIDAVFQWKDKKTYFFKGKGYWKFNDDRMSVENERQLPSGPKWLGCPLSERSNEHKHYFLSNRGMGEDTKVSTSSASARSLHSVAGVILITHIIGFIRILTKFL